MNFSLSHCLGKDRSMCSLLANAVEKCGFDIRLSLATLEATGTLAILVSEFADSAYLFLY